MNKNGKRPNLHLQQPYVDEIGQGKEEKMKRQITRKALLGIRLFIDFILLLV